MAIYLCAVSYRFPENYQIGLHACTWGVEERYRKRIANVKPGDVLVFLVGGQYRSIHQIESPPFVAHESLWPEKDGDHFPHRIKISAPMYVGTVGAAGLADRISFMKGKTWGGTIQGASGVFNNRLTGDDLELIKSQMMPAYAKSLLPEPIKARETSERQLALFRFYESDVEEKIVDSLDPLGLRLYRDEHTGRDGRQFIVDKGRIDLLCQDVASGEYVVVELKKGEAPQETLLQILRYMSWVRQHMADGRNVRGIILTESADSVLSQVVIDVPNVSIRYYKLTVDILPVEKPASLMGAAHMGRLLQKRMH